MAGGFGKYTQKVWARRSFTLRVGVMCLGDSAKLIVTDREELAGEQGHPGSQKWNMECSSADTL